MVESAGFENRYLGVTGIAGSNPALSAIPHSKRVLQQIRFVMIADPMPSRRGAGAA